VKGWIFSVKVGFLWGLFGFVLCCWVDEKVGISIVR